MKNLFVFAASLAATCVGYEASARSIIVSQPALPVPLTDPELHEITGMALDGKQNLRIVADSDAANNFRQFSAVTRTMFDNWLVDVAAPIIAGNRLIGG